MKIIRLFGLDRRNNKESYMEQQSEDTNDVDSDADKKKVPQVPIKPKNS